MYGTFGWSGSASAAEIDEAVEQGWAEVDRERYGAARDAAQALLRRDVGHAGARELFLQASASSGWGSGAVVELEGEVAAPAWASFSADLAAHVAAADKKALKTDLAAHAAAWPHEPDLMAPLWSQPDGVVGAARARWVSSQHPEAWSVEALLRWRRIARDLDAPALHAEVASALAAKGLVIPDPPRSHYDLRAVGQTWSEAPPTALGALPSEVPVAGGHLDEIWTKAARWAELRAFWTLVGEGTESDVLASERRAAAAFASKDVPTSRAEIGAAFVALGAPLESDRVALGHDRHRADVIRVLVTRARVALAEGDVLGARADLGTAMVLAEKQLDDNFADKIDHQVAMYEGPLEPKYKSARTPAVQVAVGRALAAGPPEQADARLAAARDARALALVGTGVGGVLAADPEAWASVLGDTWYAEGRVHLDAGRPADARAALVIATLLLPDDPEAWERRAAAHEALGERDAAFAALALARGRGSPDLAARLQAAYAGLGAWDAVAVALGGAAPASPPAPRVRGVPGVGRGGSVAKGAGPRLGEPFPKASLGGVSLSGLRTRVVVISAFRSDCSECLGTLPAYAQLASRLRRQAIEMVLVPLSTDDDAAFDEVADLAEGWGQLAHDPGAADALGIRRYPTTWVVDRQGVTRYFVDHWVSAQELEAMVRQTP